MQEIIEDIKLWGGEGMMRLSHCAATCVLFVVCLAGSSFAEELSSVNPSNCERGFCTGIPCERGKCEGWEGSYEPIPGTGGATGAYTANFFFRNRSGKSAFNVKIHVNFYDVFGDYIARKEKKEEGPIHNWVNMSPVRVPHNASKITYDIYWSDEYIPTGQIGG
jgi:hypothetical protein